MLKSNNYFLLALIWTIVITYLSLTSVEGFNSSIKIPYKDKMVHFVFYFLFFLLWYKSFNKLWNFNKAFFILLITVFYGVLMEVFQDNFTAKRTADFFDVLANSTGAIVSFLLTKKYFSNNKE